MQRHWLRILFVIVFAASTGLPAALFAGRKRPRSSVGTTSRILTERHKGHKVFMEQGKVFWIRLRERALAEGVWQLKPFESKAVRIVRETADYEDTWTYHWFKKVRRGGAHLWVLRAAEPGVIRIEAEILPLKEGAPKKTWSATVIVTGTTAAPGPPPPTEAVAPPTVPPEADAEEPEPAEAAPSEPEADRE